MASRYICFSKEVVLSHAILRSQRRYAADDCQRKVDIPASHSMTDLEDVNSVKSIPRYNMLVKGQQRRQWDSAVRETVTYCDA